MSARLSPGCLVVWSLVLLAASCTRSPQGPASPRLAVGSPEISESLRQEARQQLVLAIGHNDPVIRTHAIEAIKESLGSAGRSEILAAFVDPEPLVRFAAAMAAGELRLEAARPGLIRLLSDADASVQVGATFALHRLGETRYSKGLEDALRHPDPRVRANAALALGRLGEKTALRVLRPVLKDRSVEVRLQVAEAMWRLGDQEGLKYLVAAGLSGHPGHQMVGLLAMAGPRDPNVIEHVRSGLGSDYVEVALVAGRALGMLGSDEGFNLAVTNTQSHETRQRYLAALALGAIGRADARNSLTPLLKDPDQDVRIAASAALLQLRAPAVAAGRND